MPQGSKREQDKAAKLASGAPIKKWNRGAPLSKKSKGLGVRQGANGRFEAAGEQPRDSQLPTSVPMPSAVEDIRDAGMRAMWEAGGSGEAVPAAMPQWSRSKHVNENIGSILMLSAGQLDRRALAEGHDRSFSRRSDGSVSFPQVQ